MSEKDHPQEPGFDPLGVTLESEQAPGPASSDPGLDQTLGSQTTMVGEGEQLRPGMVVDRFEIKEVLGRGASGVVYRAWDPMLSRSVAIKVLLGGSAEESGRFKREAVLVARIGHPGVVAVHQVGSFLGRPYFVMDHVDGLSLGGFLQQNQGLGLRDKLGLFLELCQVVQAAHFKGVIHRDLKPANLMVTEGTVKVLDFGLAKLHSQDGEDALKTSKGMILGTPAYMAPEQAMGRHEEVDTRTDIFSLGVILYELVTGVRPFRQTSVAGIIHAVVYEPPEPPPRSVDRDLFAIISRLLEKKPQDRYQNLGAVMADLRSYLAGEPVSVRPRSFWAMGWFFIRRHYLAASIVAALILAVPLGLLVRQIQKDRQVNQLLSEAGEHLARLSGLSNDYLDLAERFRSQPPSAGDLVTKQQAAERIEAETVESLSLVEQALALEPGDVAGGQVRVDIYLERIRLAESLGQPGLASMYKALASAHARGEEDLARIQGSGTVNLGPSLRGSRLELFQVAVDDSGVMTPGLLERFESAPRSLTLALGSYLMKVQTSGQEDMVLPFLVRRDEEVLLDPVLLPAGSIPPGYSYVPEGKFFMGVPGDTFGDSDLPWMQVGTRGYLMRNLPFSAGEMLEFLQTRPPDQRGLRSSSSTEPKPLLRWEEGRGGVLAVFGQELNQDQPLAGQDWTRLAIGLLNYQLAREVVRWEGERLGTRCTRIPTLEQYHKAARGADGRNFPWGNIWLPQASAVVYQDNYQPITSPVGSHDLDTSIYGIKDLAGNVTSWTSTVYRTRYGRVKDYRYVAGNAYSRFPAPIYYINWFDESESSDDISVRPVIDLDCYLQELDDQGAR